ncbi:hypothetical protein SPONN_2362 [uncultured Candidatus Thioglobus sp.]|nr:hypothetical protein SPONL_1158 [uncultured Candidatus Thioglobus sp.]SMN01289.1 hypothetical protein SPONN_2362 [uncultured Candidatus Thioglobus sp.]
MPRKFRLSVPKKSELRKRRNNHIAPATIPEACFPVSIQLSLLSGFTVSLPLSTVSKTNLVLPLRSSKESPLLFTSGLNASVPCSSVTEESTLTVSLPFHGYLQGPVKTLPSLEEKLKASHILPSSTNFLLTMFIVTCYYSIDWSIISLNEAHLTLLKTSQCAGTTLFEISIDVNQDLQWKICIRSKEFSLPADFPLQIPPIITSVSTLRKLVTYLSDMVVCAGNPDERFMLLASARKGTFYNVSGSYIVMNMS